MENTIVVILASLLVLQVVGIYLLLIRRRFKVTNGEVDLEKFLRDLGEDVESGRRGVEKNVKDFIFNIQNHNSESKDLLASVGKKTDSLLTILKNDSIKNKEEIENIINGLIEALSNSLSDVSKKADEVIGNIQNDSIESKKEIENTISSLSGALKSMLDTMKNDIEVMKDEVAALKKLTLDKDEKLKRYEEGYDQKNIKNFREELFRILHFIEDKKVEDDSEALIEVYEDLGLLLEDVGIETINIASGDKYDGNEKIAAVKGEELTGDLEKDRTIFKKVRDGYSIPIANGSEKVLRPAEIIIYKYDDNLNIKENIGNDVNEVADTVNQQNDKENNTEGK